MLRWVGTNFLHSLLAVLAAVTIVFFLARMTGSPASMLLPIGASVETIERLTRLWGLDQPVHVQYVRYLGNIVSGDFGPALMAPGVGAMELVVSRLPATLQLGFVTLLGAVVLGAPLGVLAAIYRDSVVDRLIRLTAALAQAVPPFWLAIVLVWVVAVGLRWLPVAGRGDWRHLVLPAMAMGAYQFAAILRLMRSSMLDVMEKPYILLSKAKGLEPLTIILKHALKNAASVPLTYFGVTVGILLTGSIVVETIFAWPGLGRLAMDAVFVRDFATLQAVVLAYAVIYLMANLLVDLLYGLLNPKVRVDPSPAL